MSFTKLDYCQYLLSSPVNYTVTNLAAHLQGISHDRINRYLCGEKLTPRLLWDNNGETGQFWVIDYRLYDPDGDEQSKLDHVAAMLKGIVRQLRKETSLRLRFSFHRSPNNADRRMLNHKEFTQPQSSNRFR